MVLRLPPYHCELNPTELAWAVEKNYVAAENKEMTLCWVDGLFIKNRSELPGEFWKNCVEHVKKLRGAREEKEESYIESDKIIDLQIESVRIELGNELPESDNGVTDSGSECHPLRIF